MFMQPPSEIDWKNDTVQPCNIGAGQHGHSAEGIEPLTVHKAREENGELRA